MCTTPCHPLCVCVDRSGPLDEDGDAPSFASFSGTAPVGTGVSAAAKSAEGNTFPCGTGDVDLRVEAGW